MVIFAWDIFALIFLIYDHVRSIGHAPQCFLVYEWPLSLMFLSKGPFWKMQGLMLIWLNFAFWWSFSVGTLAGYPQSRQAFPGVRYMLTTCAIPHMLTT